MASTVILKAHKYEHINTLMEDDAITYIILVFHSGIVFIIWTQEHALRDKKRKTWGNKIVNCVVGKKNCLYFV